MASLRSIIIRLTVSLVLSLGLGLSFSIQAQAAPVCFCSVFTDPAAYPKDINLNVFDDASKYDGQCLPNIDITNCVEKGDGIDAKFTSCEVKSSPEACSARKQEFDESVRNAAQVVASTRNGTLSPDNGTTPTTRPKGLLANVLPDCVFDASVKGECKDVNIFIKLAIDVANVLLSIVGGIALIAFLYGGFTLILSQGSAETIDKGKGAMVAALIGLAVVFGAYLLVNILSDALGVSSTFRLQ